LGIEATRMNARIEHDPPEIVSTESLEGELSLVHGAAAGSLAGVFGPRSITWQVDREAAIFLGAGRALLLELAHPWIAAAIEQHSDTLANPVGRFHRTFGTVSQWSSERSLKASTQRAACIIAHASITGTLQSAAGPFPALSWMQASTWSSTAADVLKFDSAEDAVVFFDHRKPAKINAGICPIVGSGS
jgi:uncharacterized protein (DUF2236 family)